VLKSEVVVYEGIFFSGILGDRTPHAHLNMK
jgi:hypothetical protein